MKISRKAKGLMLVTFGVLCFIGTFTPFSKIAGGLASGFLMGYGFAEVQNSNKKAIK